MTKDRRVRNHLVPEFWAKGKKAANHRHSFSTDGIRLYSYGLMIGDTCPDTGAKVLRDYTAKGKWGFQSQTTSCHVGNARLSADVIDG